MWRLLNAEVAVVGDGVGITDAGRQRSEHDRFAIGQGKDQARRSLLTLSGESLKGLPVEWFLASELSRVSPHSSPSPGQVKQGCGVLGLLLRERFHTLDGGASGYIRLEGAPVAALTSARVLSIVLLAIMYPTIR